MKVSIRDVAKRAGVSVATVSRVINQSAGVKSSKEAAVREAMAYYDYHPSQFARGLATGRTQIIGVYSPFSRGTMFDEGYLLECLRGIDAVLSESQYSLLLISESAAYDKNQSLPPKFLEYVKQKRIDGLILLHVAEDERTRLALDKLFGEGFPIGYIGKRFHHQGFNVYAGYEAYRSEALERFYNNGHRELLYMGTQLRRRDYHVTRKIMLDYPKLHIHMVELRRDMSMDQCKQIFEEYCIQKKCTAILCDNLQLLATGMMNILFRMGLRIPEDISIISVEHVENRGAQIFPPVNCYYVPAMQMGSTVAKKLITALECGSCKEPETVFTTEYKNRKTVKCLNE